MFSCLICNLSLYLSANVGDTGLFITLAFWDKEILKTI